MSNQIPGKLVLVIIPMFSKNICAQLDHFTCGSDELAERSGIDSTKIWPQGRVPYVLINLRDRDIEVFMEAVKDFEIHTCIRLVPKEQSDEAFIRVHIDYSPTKYCGLAESCFLNRSQFITIGSDCSIIQIYVHEINHALCLTHEHVRPDRDEFLSFKDCPAEKIPKIKINAQLRGHFYDYHSQVHYGCYGECWGSPTIRGVRKCGYDANLNGLSLMDADKINDYYNCKGCHRHRWYNTANLTSNQRQYLVNFGSREGDKQPVYACRTYTDANIGIGTYDHGEKACVLEGFEKVFVVKKHVQLFGMDGRNTVVVVGNVSESQPKYAYQLLQVDPHETCETCVAAGRYGDDISRILFIAVTEVNSSDGKKHTLVGSREDKSPYGWFVDTVNGTRQVVDKNEFFVVHCTGGTVNSVRTKTTEHLILIDLKDQ